jgi:hypothetical protein
LAAILPHLKLARIGPGKTARVAREVGTILSGLMKQHFSG